VSDRVRARIAQDRWIEALEEARAFAVAHPDSAVARGLVGEALYRAGRLDEAASTLAGVETADSPPSRVLMTLGLVRAAEGNDAEAAALLDRALAGAPDDRDVVFHASEVAPTRARAVELLEKYLALSAGDDGDRIEGARGTIRVYRALGERRTWIPESRPDRVEVPLFPLPGAGGRNRGYLVEADLGARRKTRVLLDTGSAGLFLLERIASKGKLEPLAEETVFAGGGEGRHASSRGILPSFAIGDLRFKDALVVTTTRELEPTGRYHGILGLAAFQGYAVVLDLAASRLVLEKPAEAARGTRYFTVGGQMLVAGDAAEAGPALFLFDTGASRSGVATGLVARIPGASLGAPVSVSGYGGAMPGARVARGVRVALPGFASLPSELVAADLTLRSRLGGVEVSGSLGLDVLDGHRIVVDTVGRRIEIAGGRR
jgi:hypothetical protein